MKLKLMFVFLMFISSALALSAAETKLSDNGAVYYLKLFKMCPDINEIKLIHALFRVDSLETLAELDPEVRNKFDNVFSQKFIKLLIRALRCKVCDFNTLNVSYSFMKKYKNFPLFIKNLGWIAVSMKKYNLGTSLFISSMKLSKQLFNSGFFANWTGFGMPRFTLKSLINYMDMKPGEKIENKIIKFVNAFSKPYVSLLSYVEKSKTSYLKLIRNADKNPSVLAGFFYFTDPPNKRKCEVARGNWDIRIGLALEEGCLQKNDERSFDEITEALIRNKYVIKGALKRCPSGGKYTIIWGEKRPEIICSVHKGTDYLIFPDKDPARIKAASDYVKSDKFEADKKQFSIFCDKIIELVKSGHVNDDELKRYSDKGRKEFSKNKFIQNNMMSLYSYRKSMKAIKKIVTDITYEANNERFSKDDFLKVKWPVSTSFWENANLRSVKKLIGEVAGKKLVKLSLNPVVITRIAENCSDPKVLKFMIEHGFDVNTKDKKGNTLVMLATTNSNKVLKELIDLKADLTIKNRREETPLLYAMHHWYKKSAIETLIKHGADVNARDIDGNSAVILLASNEFAEEISKVLKMLVQAGADIHVKNINGKNYFTLNQDSRLSVVKTLVELGLNINEKDGNNVTVLQKAIQTGGKPFYIKGLVDLGANILPEYLKMAEGNPTIHELLKNLMKENQKTK